MAGHPHRLRANRVPPLVPVPQLHAVGRDADNPEPAPTPRHLHPGSNPNPGRRLVPLGRRGRPDSASAEVEEPAVAGGEYLLSEPAREGTSPSPMRGPGLTATGPLFYFGPMEVMNWSKLTNW